jgi:hypothetical protein
MKRLMLAVLLGVVAAVVAPVASASAAEHVECTFKGTATFATPLTAVPTVALDEYKFTSDGSAANKCNGEAGAASVKGKGHLSCTVSPGLGVSGLVATFESGSLTAKGKTFTLSTFEFEGAGAAVPFDSEGEEKTSKEKFVGTGLAKFIETAKALEECAGAGLGSVGFEATAHGVVR